MQVLPAKKIEEALNILARDMEVFAPIWRGSMSGFFKWTNDEEDDLVFEVLNTYLSPKNVVIPQTEKMYAFKTSGQDAEVTKVELEISDKLIFGIRSCDIKGLEALDLVFLTRGYVDEFYRVRREKTTVIARTCYEPGKACFCDSMGVDRINPAADVITHELTGGDLVWEAKTEKGARVTEKIAHLMEEREVTLPTKKEQAKKVAYEGLAEKLKGMFEDPVWDKLAERCINCGVCTNVCPTCYCFDIQVKVWGDEGYRFRCWDSCMYREYTLMAGGHNPRPDKKERFRNRFLHKLEFFNERYGTPLCTGCGRCVVLCPNMVNIVEVIKALQEVGPDA